MSSEFDKEVPDQAPLLQQLVELDEKNLQAMQDAGRYTLEGADTMLVRFAGTTPGKLLKSLLRTVKDDAGKRAKDKELPLHNPNAPERLESHTIRTFHEVATAKNLNTWLTKNHPEINWRFPEPTSQKVGAGDTAIETPQEHRAEAAKKARGVKREILIHWDGIAKLNGRDADAAQVARYLKTKRNESEHAPKRKTIHNRLGELRVAKLIP